MEHVVGSMQLERRALHSNVKHLLVYALVY
jgi:hypothetical protein